MFYKKIGIYFQGHVIKNCLEIHIEEIFKKIFEHSLSMTNLISHCNCKG